MVSLVLVSHSNQVALGLKELVSQMTQGKVAIAAAGGTADGALGTDAERIAAAVREVYSPNGVLILLDLGSAVLSAELALELLPAEWRPHLRLSDAPLVEGAVVAGVEAMLGRSLAEVNHAAESALMSSKFS